MPRGSKRYVQLASRLAELQRNLLPFLPVPPAYRTTYIDQELDATRAYIVLAHAEIEAFCEDIVNEKAKTAKDLFDSHQRVTPVLRRIVSYYVGKNRKSWSEVRTPSADTVRSASESHLTTVRENNGVKRQNLERLLYPLGVVDAHMNATWLAEMDSFGAKRGDMAHRSGGVVTAPDPPGEVATVGRLLVGLLTLDRALGGLR